MYFAHDSMQAAKIDSGLHGEGNMSKTPSIDLLRTFVVYSKHRHVGRTAKELGVKQPVVVSNRLRNVPAEGIYNFDPGAFFGMYRPDTFWFAGPARTAVVK